MLIFTCNLKFDVIFGKYHIDSTVTTITYFGCRYLYFVK